MTRSFLYGFIAGMTAIVAIIILLLNPLWMVVICVVGGICIWCYLKPPFRRQRRRQRSSASAATLMVYVLVIAICLLGIVVITQLPRMARADHSTDVAIYPTPSTPVVQPPTIPNTPLQVTPPQWYQQRLREFIQRGQREYATNLIVSMYMNRRINEQEYQQGLDQLTAANDTRPTQVGGFIVDLSGSGQILAGSSREELLHYYHNGEKEEFLPNIFLSNESQKSTVSTTWLAGVFCLVGVCGTDQHPVVVVVGGIITQSDLNDRILAYTYSNNGKTVIVTRGDLNNFETQLAIFHEIYHLLDILTGIWPNEFTGFSEQKVIECGHCELDRVCYEDCVATDRRAGLIDEETRLRQLSEIIALGSFTNP